MICDKFGFPVNFKKSNLQNTNPIYKKNSERFIKSIFIPTSLKKRHFSNLYNILDYKAYPRGRQLD
jgi:hypothetical protein